MSKDICPDCGYPWEIHDFGVPMPDCPSDSDVISYLYKKLVEQKNINLSLLASNEMYDMEVHTLTDFLEYETIRNGWILKMVESKITLYQNQMEGADYDDFIRNEFASDAMMVLRNEIKQIVGK